MSTAISNQQSASLDPRSAALKVEEFAAVNAIIGVETPPDSFRRHIAEVVMDRAVTMALQKLGNMNGTDKEVSRKSLMQFASGVRRLASR